ncbi:MAG: hypothetical protein GVY36_04125 [Verrucomicrobia bacterium]|nr:hypothetical protein [Verrucomicrobiota bacterium]
MKAPSRETDLDGLAAMLIALEHSQSLSIKCFHTAEACLGEASKRMFPWIDSIPWHIVCDQLVSPLQLSPSNHFDYAVVVDHLDESRSALRLWALEIAWFVRNLLDSEEAAKKLFENVANTLANTAESWGLAASLFPDSESFYQAADTYLPEDFQDQYEDRKEFYQKLYPLSWQAHFWQLEAQLRRRIQLTIEGPAQTFISF